MHYLIVYAIIFGMGTVVLATFGIIMAIKQNTKTELGGKK